ncbi:GNAT family N-acetyltransferase [Streptomyces sp. L7]
MRHVLTAADEPTVRSRPEVPAGYRLRTWSRAGVTRALVRTEDGAFAARGQIAVTGSTAVVDQVETDPAHRRRGLGRLVMAVLADAAAGQGAVVGVLGATPEGRALYECSRMVRPGPTDQRCARPGPGRAAVPSGVRGEPRVFPQHLTCRTSR